MLKADVLRRLAAALLILGAVAALAVAWLLRDAPAAPGLARGLLRADALGAFFALLTACLALAELAVDGEAAPAGLLGAAGMLALAYLSGHLAALAILFALAGLLRGRGLRPAAALPLLCLALGLGSLGLQAGEWRYGEPGAGAGMNGLSFALLLLAALLGGGTLALADGRDGGTGRQLDPILGPALLYPLLRLDSLGPWDLSWLSLTLLLGAAVALWAGWRAARDDPQRAGVWLPRHLLGMALVGLGLGSGAGLALTAFALLALPLIRLGLGAAPGPARPWPLWALSAAAPIGAPFVVTWAGVAAATAGGVPSLALALWAASLLAAAPLARRAANGAGPPWPQDRRLLLAAALSAALGLGAPLALEILVTPMVAQLAGGLSPLGEITLWPWAGLRALDSHRQQVASLPTLALAGLGAVLAALAQLGARLRHRRTERGGG